MELKMFLYKHRREVNVVLSLISLVITSIYFSLISNNMSSGSGFWESVNTIPGSYLYILGIIACLVLQYYMDYSIEKRNDNEKKAIIEAILKNACKAFTYPHRYHIRAIITVCDYKNNIRKSTYSYNISASPERDAVYDLDFGITGEALRRKIPIAVELPENHIEDYDERHKFVVEERLRSILAIPVFSKSNPDTVIAVLAFDSIDTLDKMKFNTDRSKELGQSWADVISEILD